MVEMSLSLQCVFHSIRFKVNKGWAQRSPFLLPLSCVVSLFFCLLYSSFLAFRPGVCLSVMRPWNFLLEQVPAILLRISRLSFSVNLCFIVLKSGLGDAHLLATLLRKAILER